jgi:hypothetical protein
MIAAAIAASSAREMVLVIPTLLWFTLWGTFNVLPFFVFYKTAIRFGMELCWVASSEHCGRSRVLVLSWGS